MSTRHSLPFFRELTPVPDVLGAFEHVLRLPYPILFDSATDGGDAGAARYSYVAADPRVVVRAKGGDVEVVDCRSGTTIRRAGRALDVARHVAGIVNPEVGSEVGSRERPSRESLPPFHGGVAGYVAYEYGAILERLPAPRQDDLGLPDVLFGVYDWVVAWDHVRGRAWVIGSSEAQIDDAVAILAHKGDRFGSPGRYRPHGSDVVPDFASTFSSTEYEEAVDRVRDYIRAGDVFQVNLSQRFSNRCDIEPWELYRHLRDINPAPFGSFFRADDFSIVSVSPERFLALNEDGMVETRPIKGTRPRSESPDEDEQLREQLMTSAKDAAEHVMIVDVLRNDLSRVCKVGSVHVPSLMAHERHATVHHLVSTVTGQLRQDADAIDLLHASFPGGSITGAPKIRAMEIIAELEPVARGVYCGAIGWISASGAMDTSIAIRTCVVKDGRAYFSAGGGVVADSDPRAEYEETLDKARAIMRALGVTRPSGVAGSSGAFQG